MARFYHLRYERTKKDADETAKRLRKHLSQFRLPAEVKVKPRPDLEVHEIRYQILTRATPKQIDLLHDLLNRDVKWDRRMVVSKTDVKEETDPVFRKHLSKLHRKTKKGFKATEKRFVQETARQASVRRKR